MSGLGEMDCVGGFAGAEDSDELPVGLGANPQELVVHGGERVRAEIIDLLQVAEFKDHLFKSGVQSCERAINVRFHRHGLGGWLWVEAPGWMECVSFLNSHIACLRRCCGQGAFGVDAPARPLRLWFLLLLLAFALRFG